MQQKNIIIKSASEHNLKNISLEIPTNQLIVVTGVSGSGKSSLAYDIIFKEGQRKFLETFSNHSRMLMGKLRKPDVEEIINLSPALAVEQKTVQSNVRSTVGTLSGIYDSLRLLFARYGNETIDISPLKKERRLFSFNSDAGYCPHCKGIGMEEIIDPDKLIKDPNLSLRQGALVITLPNGYTIYSQVTIDVLNQVCESEGFNVDIPWKDLTDFQKNIILNGSNKILIPFGKHTLESRMKWTGITAKPREEGFYKGILPIMSDILKRDRNDNILRFVSSKTCSHCQGKRLRKEALSILVDNKTIADFNELSIFEIHNYFITENDSEIFNLIAADIRNKSELLVELGLGYLQLNRESTTLSGGESQRIRLVNQAHIKLSGLTYVLDEPSIGLHPADNAAMIKLMRRLVENRNTVFVIEHDEETIKAADWIIDIGEYAGPDGGKLLFNGSVKEFLQTEHQESKTWQYLSHYKNIERQITTQNTENEWIKLQGAKANNLKNLDVQFKKSALNLVTGVSGAGKSSLVFECLIPALKNIKNGNWTSVSGHENIKQIIEIDQLPIGRTPRSNPATYTKLFDHIRDLYAAQEESKKRKYPKGRFSFNVEGGRCEACQGAGYQQIGMHFLGNVDIECDVCEGKRFNDETLEITYSGKNIREVLDLSFAEAEDFFKNEKTICNIIHITNQLGLGYLKLGQAATTLSGGEAQRIKLSAELSKAAVSQKNKKPSDKIYILDEPTTGLHFYDIQILLNSIQILIDQGNTIILIEHDTSFIKLADHIIDLGPGSGKMGGNLIFEGNINDFKSCEKSVTASCIFGKKSKQISQKFVTGNSEFIDCINLTINNIKGENIRIRKNAINVVCGPSGSGKSSFAFDALYAEGRNQYLDGLSAYIRSFLVVKSNYSIDSMNGLCPTVAIKTTRNKHNPRSTVGIYSELYDLVRLLFSRIGREKNGDKTRHLSSDFSFNHQQTACKSCKGLGTIQKADFEKYITHPEKSVLNGALDGTKTGKFYGDPFGQYVWTLKAAGDFLNIDFSVPFNHLTKDAKEIVFNGFKNTQFDIDWHFKRKNSEGVHRFKGEWKGFSNLIEEEYHRKHTDKNSEDFENLLSEYICPDCKGERLIKEMLEVNIQGVNIAEFSRLELTQCRQIIKSWKQNFSANENQIALPILEKIDQKLTSIISLGLGYLQSDRQISTLSGGELQRLTLASQIYSGLSGVCYILDEPSIGLHPQDVAQLKNTLIQLKEKGNTLVVVEHDAEIIEMADFLIEFGPGGGNSGGKIVCNSDLKFAKSPTLQNIRSAKLLNKQSDLISHHFIEIKGANAHNLKHINVRIPTNCIMGISGVSGSGKSTLLRDVLYKSFRLGKVQNCESIFGLEVFDDLIMMNQGIDGFGSTTTVAGISGILNELKTLFASTLQAKNDGKKANFFSYLSKESRCPICNGSGIKKQSMDFLQDVVENCPQCKGTRYNVNILNYTYLHKNIAEIMSLNLQEAGNFFAKHPGLSKRIKYFLESGLGYLKLNQSGSSLSSGEIQRLRLAADLANHQGKKNLYLLDEPGNGLHISDLKNLIILMESLIKAGHSVILIEHNSFILNICDHIIQLGPKGGNEGGFLLE